MLELKQKKGSLIKLLLFEYLILQVCSKSFFQDAFKRILFNFPSLGLFLHQIIGNCYLIRIIHGGCVPLATRLRVVQAGRLRPSQGFGLVCFESYLTDVVSVPKSPNGLVAAGTRVESVHFQENKQKDKERDKEHLSPEDRFYFHPIDQGLLVLCPDWLGLACALVQLARACLQAMISWEIRFRSPGKCHIYPSSQVSKRNSRS